MSKVISNLAYPIVSRLPAGTVRRLTGKKLLLPFYHAVSDEELPHVTPAYRVRTVAEFTRDLDFLLGQFKPIGLAELLDHVRNGHSFAEDCFHLTFDDGLRQIYDVVAPILKAKGVPATFFLTADFIDNRNLGYFFKRDLLVRTLEADPATLKTVAPLLGTTNDHVIDQCRRLRYDDQGVMDEVARALDFDFAAFLRKQKPFMDSTQIGKLIADGFTIGAHSLDHPLYALLSLKEQLRQTTESVRIITERFALPYRVFAFPSSDMGVSRTYYDEVFGQNIVEISFGASGLVDDVYPRSLQRLWMEYGALPAEERLRTEMADYCLMKLTDREKVQRWG